MNPKLKELRGRTEHLRKELHKWLEQAGPDLEMSKVTAIDGDSTTKVAYFRELNDELDQKMAEMEPLEAEHKAMVNAREKLAHLGQPADSHPGFPVLSDQGAVARGVAQQKSFGQLFVENWKNAGRAKGETFEIKHVSPIEISGVKTVMSTGAGWAPETIRTGRLVEAVIRPPQVLDIIPDGTTTQSAVVYMQESAVTNAAVEVAESVEGTPGTYPEQALALTEVTDSVRKIAVWIPITDEQLEDEAQVRSYLDMRLPFLLRQRLDLQVLVGNGTAPNLSGILDRSGLQTQAKGTDPTPDAVYKAIVKCQIFGSGNGGANPDFIVMNPLDWQDVRLLRTADGIYIYGSPSDSGIERMWGLPVIKSSGLTENTGLVGDFSGFSQLLFKRGIEVKVTDSHGTFFIEGKQAVRADLRAAFVVYRPAAYCSVTSI